ncbi:MAG TPA: HAD family phosphatase [Alphaproteobacteria bacterium]|nr:HAD family phosphatase [Alphaproteobacteria bacterium]HOO50181.1 HAD family phosphatase [Alphaproteobacteria bacterium]
MVKNKLLICDVDGTLAKSAVPLNLAFLRALEVYGIPDFIDMHYLNHDCIGLSVPDLVQKISSDAKIDIPPSVMDEYLKFVPDLLKEYLSSDPQAVRVLSKIQEIYDMTAGSNGRTFNVVRTIEAVGLDGIFQENVIYTPEKVGLKHGKPAPDLFLHIARERGFSPLDTVVLEDSPTGVQAGFAANMRVIGTTVYSEKPHVLEANLRAEGVTQIARTWDQVYAFLMN